MLGGAELVEVSSDGEPGDKARFVRGVERALLDGEADDRRPLGQGRAGGAARGPGARRGAAARGPGRRLGRRRLARSTTCPRAPGSGPRACAGARSCSPRGPTSRWASCTATSTPACASSAEGELDAIVLAAAGLRRLGPRGRGRVRAPGRGDDPGRRPGRAACCRPATDDEAALRAGGAISDERGAARADRRARRRRPARARPAPARSASTRTARAASSRIAIDAFVGLPDGSEWVRDRVEGDVDRAGRCSAPSSPSACSAPAPARSSTAPRSA